MAEFPSMPIFTDALIGDTQHLSDGEFGSYMLLLLSSWRRPGCDLPDSDEQLARIARCTPHVWRKRRAVLVAFFAIEDGCWRQKRLREVRAHVAKISKIRSDVRKRRVSAKPLNGQEPPPTIVPTKEPSIASLSKTKDKKEVIEANHVETVSPHEPKVPPPGVIEPSARSVLWREAKAFLGGSNPGALVGRWCADYGEGAFVEAYFAARKEDPAEPVAWIRKALEHRAKRQGRDEQAGGSEYILARARAKIAELDARRAAGEAADVVH